MKIDIAGIRIAGDIGEKEKDLAEILLGTFSGIVAGYSVREAIEIAINRDKPCGCCKDNDKTFSELLTEQQVSKSLIKAQEKDVEAKEEIKAVEEVKLVEKAQEVKEVDNGAYKFLIGECNCGQQHYLPIYENAKNPYGIKCRKCGRENKVDYNELVKRTTTCSICGYVAEFWTAPDDWNLKKVDCRSCGGKVSVGKK